MFSVLDHMQYSGDIFLINPGRQELWGRRCYPDFASLPARVDHAAVLVSENSVLNVLRDGAANGLGFATIYGTGFGEGADPESHARGRELQSFVAEREVRVCGPNCMGFVSFPARAASYPARFPLARSGPVGGVFHSGGALQYFVRSGADRGVGFSHLVSSGNEIDIDLTDYANLLIDDPNTSTIVLVIEGIRKPDAFLTMAGRALAAGKPLVVMKTGRSKRAQVMAQSHTGALAGDDLVFDAVCERYGIIRCGSFDDLLETVVALQVAPPRGGRGAFAFTSGGLVSNFLDQAELEGVEIPDLQAETVSALVAQLPPSATADNPADFGGGATNDEGLFASLCQTMASDPGIDFLAIHGTLPNAPGEGLIRDPETLTRLREAVGKPVYALGRMAHSVSDYGREFQASGGVPFLHGIPASIRALSAIGRYGARSGDAVPSLPPSPAGGGSLDGSALERALRDHRIPLPLSRITADVDEAVAAASDIGYPVVLKIISADVSHKTEAGGVLLGLRNEEDVRRGAESLRQSLARYRPDASLDGFLVQEMASGTELLIGVREDPQFGPFMVVGLGGIFAEILRDVAIRLLPVSPTDIHAMLGELRGGEILNGARGRALADKEAIVDTALGLQSLFLDHRSALSDIEINPLMVRPAGSGAVAVDVRVARKEAAPDVAAER